MPLRTGNDKKCMATEKKRHHLEPFFFPPWQTIQKTFSTLQQKKKKFTPKKIKTERSTPGNGGENFIEGQNCINT